MKVEFVGGPLDGETAELPDAMREFRVPVRAMAAMWGDDGSVEFASSALDALRYGVYSPVGKPTVFHWQGVPDSSRERERTERLERAELPRLKAKYDL